MTQYTAPPAINFYAAHKLEAKKVTNTETELYRRSGELTELSPEEEWARNQLSSEFGWAVEEHKIAHVALAQGIVRSRKDYARQEGAYQQEALEDAVEAGYEIEGWQLFTTEGETSAIRARMGSEAMMNTAQMGADLERQCASDAIRAIWRSPNQ